ncbi:hypothetical protein AB1Y20_015252 [Prymnesium parvum]|uniref:Protein arginine methyltransferase NDUFAF7 n=1 Tax=Prymnesium parvum TaxID=97485 RepID=A0AB34JZW0_PRYPA
MRLATCPWATARRAPSTAAARRWPNFKAGRFPWRASGPSLDRAYCETAGTVAIQERRRPTPQHNPAFDSGLLREIARHVRFHGPLTVKEFMMLALTHPKHGYYMNGEIFGRGGDFVTSPEMSQTFGELLGVWCVASWEQLGRPPAVRLAELGPGRGTLMLDLLRSTSVFPAFRAALSVHLVEVSPHLRRCQHALLSGMAMPNDAAHDVHWHSHLDLVPDDGPLLLLGHEFLDALPVHQFVNTSRGWRERMVDLREHATTHSAEQEQPVVPVVNQEETSAGGNGIGSGAVRDLDEDERHLDFVLSPTPTPASAVLTRDLESDLPQAEVSPAAQALVQEVARRIVRTRGAALFIDYGLDSRPADSLRGIIGHRFVHPLHKPGAADLSVDVDFASLRRAARAVAPELRCPPLTLQRDFLAMMGFETRVNMLLKEISDKKAREALIQAAGRLVAVPGMGSAYKAFALAHSDIPADSIPGFPPCD